MTKYLTIGSRGEEVKHWQEYLAQQGFKLPATGYFDPATLAATRKMQRKLGVKADGKVGHNTKARQEQTAATPIPQARPDMPPAPQPQAPVLAGDRRGTAAPPPFQSSGPEADLTEMGIAAMQRRQREGMAQALQSQYYDARGADLASQSPPPDWSPAFTDQGSPPTHALDQGILNARGISPNFDAAGPPGGQSPQARDQLIRMLLQQAGG